jgi:hypothetical protein
MRERTTFWTNSQGWLGLVVMTVVVMSLLFPALVLSQAGGGPNTMDFQGWLLDSSGNPRGGQTHCLRFRMCSNSSCSSSQVWPASSYEYQPVTTANGPANAGYFSVVLGAVSPIPPGLVSQTDNLFLEIAVSDGSTCPGTTYTVLTPRSQLRANAYAQRSRRLLDVEGSPDYLASLSNTGAGGGIYAETASTVDWATAGSFHANATTGGTVGVWASNNSVTDSAAAGSFHAYGAHGKTYGVFAENNSTTDWATAGTFQANATTGATVGVWASNYSVTDTATAGSFHAYGASGKTYGVFAENSSTGTGSVGVDIYANGGVGLRVRSMSYNPIEAYGSNAADRKFYVSGSGNVYADGFYYGAGGVSAGSADYAEMVLPGQADLTAGDVLCIGSDGRTVRSSAPYQSSVAGVFSTKPGFIAGNRLDEGGKPVEPGRIPLALIGIVPVKASAENGPIRPGDLLVTSSPPGHAVRAGASPPQGTVIGKALGPLPCGASIIEMLVTLQ